MVVNYREGVTHKQTPSPRLWSDQTYRRTLDRIQHYGQSAYSPADQALFDILFHE